jgi:hypothetical protein
MDCSLGLFLADGKFRGRFLPPYDLLFTARQRESLDDSNPARTRIARFDKELGWTLLPSVSLPESHDRTNAMGMRADREYTYAKPPGVMRIAAFGDSFTYGAEVDNDSSWCQQLEKSQAGLEVLNFGVSAYGTDQAYLRYLRDAAPFEIDVVLLGLQLENALRNVSVYRPAYYHRTATAATKSRFRLSPEGALELVPNPADSRAHLRELIESRKLLDLIAHEDFWVRRAPLAYRDSPLFASSLARILYGSYENWGRDPARYYQDPASEPYRTTHAIIREMHRRVVDERGARFFVVILPPRHALRKLRKSGERYWSAFVRDIELDGISQIDCSDALDRLIRTHGEKAAFVGGAHYSAAASRLVATEIATRLDEP